MYSSCVCLIASSNSPSAIVVGTLMEASSARVKAGRVSHILFTAALKASQFCGVGESARYSCAVRSRYAPKTGVFSGTVLEPGHVGIGAEREQSRQAVGMSHGEIEPDDSPVAPADQIDLRNSSARSSKPITSCAMRW